MNIDGIAAVVTGAASGLGEATARALAAKGAKVAVFDRDSDKGEKVAAEIGGIYCEVDVTSGREGRRCLRQGARGARPGAGAGQLRGGRQRGQDGRARQGDRRDQDVPAPPVRAGDRDQPGRQLPLHRAFGGGHGDARSAGGRRARGDRQHRFGRRRGRADRPGGLFGVEGRGGGDDAADRARPDERRDSRQHHPAGHLQDADDGDDAGQRAGRAGRAGAVPQAARAVPRNMPRWPASWSKAAI